MTIGSPPSQDFSHGPNCNALRVAADVVVQCLDELLPAGSTRLLFPETIVKNEESFISKDVGRPGDHLLEDFFEFE